MRSVASDELNTNAIRFALGTLADGQFRQTLSDGDAMLLKSSMNALTVYSTGSNGGSNLFQNILSLGDNSQNLYLSIYINKGTQDFFFNIPLHSIDVNGNISYYNFSRTVDLVDANDVVGFYQFRVKLSYTQSTTPTYQAILFITQIADLNDDFLPVLSGSTFIFKVKLKSRQGVYLKVNAVPSTL